MENNDKSAMPTLLYDSKTVKPNGHSTGLNNREYFAGLAMQGLSHSYFDSAIQKQAEKAGSDIDHAIAVAAVSLADALLKVLNTPADK